MEWQKLCWAYIHSLAATVSAAGKEIKGKVTPYELMITNRSYISAFTTLGQECSISNVPMDVLEQFLCQLYYRQSSLSSLFDVKQSCNFHEKVLFGFQVPPYNR